MDSGVIQIAVAFTPDYFVPAVTMLHSLFRHSAQGSRFMVHCLESREIPQREKDLLQTMFNGHAQFSFIRVNSLPPGTSISNRYSEAALYRLLLPGLLPNLERILYIDCDIIIRCDIAELYNGTTLNGHLLAAVHEPPIENQASGWKALGIDPDLYFNSGFLILNLDLMRQEDTVSRMFSLLRDDHLEFPDQDALNTVCQHRVLYLPPQYNSIRTFFIEKYRRNFLECYSMDQYGKVLQSGNIHYTGGKPWNMFTVMFNHWWREYRMLPAAAKAEWKPRYRVLLLSAITRCKPCGAVIEFARKLKHLMP